MNSYLSSLKEYEVRIACHGVVLDGKLATLLIVGELDYPVAKRNEESFERLPGIKHLARVSGATHLFEEPGALQEIATLAASWFGRYLTVIKQEGNPAS